jgi:hypothetical protein
VDIDAELTWIVQHLNYFNIVLQRVGQEVEHCEAFYHAFLTFVNPSFNPKLVCLSLGYMIVSARAFSQFINHAPSELVGYQDSLGGIKPVKLHYKSN